MTTAIHRQLKFRVRNQAAFDTCLGRAVPLLEPGSTASGGQPYWKMTELWECTTSTPVAGESVAEQVLECLLAANRAGTGWHVFGALSAESAAGFTGTFSVSASERSNHAAGLEWASFELLSAPTA